MTHTLPENPRAVVLTWQSSGGLSASANQGPDLIVRADGSVSVGERFGAAGPVQRRLSPERLEQLLTVAIDDERFFDIDSAQVEAEIDAVRGLRSESERTLYVPMGPPYVDAGTTRIMIAADGRQHEVAIQGLSAAAREYPEVGALVRLRSIELHLLTLAEELVAGQDPNCRG